MKAFTIIFIPLFLLIVFAAFCGMSMSMPIPGSDEIPDSVIREQELGARMLEVIMFPARWTGPLAALFVGPALWALVLSMVFAHRLRGQIAPTHPKAQTGESDNQ